MMKLKQSEKLRQLRRHPRPGQYFVGQTGEALSLPENILIFISSAPVPAESHDKLAHHRHVLLTIFEGRGSIIINGERFRLEPGKILLLMPHQMHLTLFDDRELFWVYTTFEMADSDLLEEIANRPLPIPDAAYQGIFELLQCNIREYGEDTLEGTRAALCILRILIEMLAAHRSGGAPTENPQQQLADRINRYLYKHLDRPLDMEELSAHFGYSPTHLRRLYREFIGMPIGAYLRNMRHARAQTLLAQSTMPLREIARCCGYGSEFAFSTAFRNREGISPGRFRAGERPGKTKRHSP